LLAVSLPTNYIASRRIYYDTLKTTELELYGHQALEKVLREVTTQSIGLQAPKDHRFFFTNLCEALSPTLGIQ